MICSSVYTDWAFRVIEYFLKTGKRLEFGSVIPPELEVKAGCFVSLHKLSHELRGCIGTIFPSRDRLLEEVRENAIAAATKDPRFSPLELEELENLAVSIDVIGTPDETTMEKLDPARYGVIVEAGWKRGVLLPGLEGINTVEDQLKIVLWKARIGAHEDYKIYRFISERYH